MAEDGLEGEDDLVVVVVERLNVLKDQSQAAAVVVVMRW